MFIANRLTIDGSGYNCLSTSNCNTHQNLAQSEHRGTMLRFLILIVRGILIDLTRRKKRAFFLRVCVSLAAIASFLRVRDSLCFSRFFLFSVALSVCFNTALCSLLAALSLLCLSRCFNTALCNSLCSFTAQLVLSC